ncbi:MAG: IS110 family transposase [Bacteroidia bacterium]|nr:IS110 family transposase [Bacteroidia bacterium]
MKKNFIIGIDVSKSKLDVHCHGQLKQLMVSNDTTGYKKLLKWIKKEVTKELVTVMVVMEYTGIYTYNLEKFLFNNQVDYVRRPALDIMRSAGMKRGKTDKADARMISQYGWYRKEELTAMKPVSHNHQKLQQLMSHRDKLVGDKASYVVRIKELKEQLAADLNKKVFESTEYVVGVLEIEIKAMNKMIEELVKTDDSFENNYRLLRSVTGIGFVTAVHMIITTENFTRFKETRKFACYCGVAPFEHQSGSSIRGKTRVSHLANKKLKSLFTTAAFAAIQHDAELKAKYEQKLKEGKSKMCALNVIRFKLIERIFAVIKRQSPYILSQAA